MYCAYIITRVTPIERLPFSRNSSVIRVTGENSAASKPRTPIIIALLTRLFHVAHMTDRQPRAMSKYVRAVVERRSSVS